jgi:hypothetical protein
MLVADAGKVTAARVVRFRREPTFRLRSICLDIIFVYPFIFVPRLVSDLSASCFYTVWRRIRENSIELFRLVMDLISQDRQNTMA